MEILRLTSNDPYRITLEEPERLAHSFHRHVFENAFRHLREIQERYAQSVLDKRSVGKARAEYFYDVDEVNNIIAFTGDRGSGKTTAMLSFVHCIQDANSIQKTMKALGMKHIDQYAEERDLIHFHVLPVVDPSKFCADEGLLGVVVARIYERITRIVDEERRDGSIGSDRIRGAVKSCEKAYQAIRNRYSGTKALVTEAPRNELEQLNNLANTSMLRKCLQQLISEYIKLDIEAQRLKYHADNTMLVIPIDDLDMSVRKGYELAEEIRNFFLLPQVMITMAVKLEQLSDLVEQKFLTDFEKMINQKNVLDTQPAEMAVKYIEKLIPHQRRIYMTAFTPQSMASLRIVYKKGSRQNQDERHEKDSEQCQDEPPAELMIDHFIQLVYTRTGILLYPNEYGSHALIPHNLRALHQTVCFFNELPKVFSGQDHDTALDIKALASNLRSVEAWLLDSVCANAIPRDLAMVIRHAAEHANDGLNAFVVHQLERCSLHSEQKGIGQEGKLEFVGLFGTDRHMQCLFDAKTYPENISIGDVMYLLYRMEQLDLSNGMMHFTAAIKLLYSLRLTAALYPLFSSAHPKEESVAKGEDEQYLEACKLIGGTFCPTQMNLLEAGKEWMVNIPTRSLVVRWDSGAPASLHYLNGKESKAVNTWAHVYSGHRLAWLSYFVISFGGRLRYKALHTYAGRYPCSRYTPRRDEMNDDLISMHWMQFLGSALMPTVTQKRFLWSVDSEKMKATYADAEDFRMRMERWRDDHIQNLCVNSIDVVFAVFKEMNRTAMQRTNNIGILQGYFDIRRALVGKPGQPNHNKEDGDPNAHDIQKERRRFGNSEDTNVILYGLRDRLGIENQVGRTLFNRMQKALDKCPLFVDDRLEEEEPDLEDEGTSARTVHAEVVSDWVEEAKMLNELLV